MQRGQKWMCGALVVAALSGVGTTMFVGGSRPAVAEDKGPGDHWRHFDGHWSYWHDGDRRWYYTDGAHWYYHDGARWVLYEFDKVFGRAGFFPGEYRRPGPGVTVEVPRHDVYRHR